MSVSKMPNGRWRARLKNGRANVTSKVFDTQKEAKAWLARERAALAGGVDPRAGKRRVRELVAEWLPIRKRTVAVKTYRADQDVERLTPTSLLSMQVASISEREIARAFERLLARVPTLELDTTPAGLRWRDGLLLRGLRGLPVRFAA